MNGFCAGDRVEAIDRVRVNGKYIEIGDTGTVCCGNFIGSIGVSWDALYAGHSCDGRCKYGTGWYVNPNCIKLHEEDSDENAEINEDSFLRIIAKA